MSYVLGLGSAVISFGLILLDAMVGNTVSCPIFTGSFCLAAITFCLVWGKIRNSKSIQYVLLLVALVFVVVSSLLFSFSLLNQFTLPPIGLIIASTILGIGIAILFCLWGRRLFYIAGFPSTPQLVSLFSGELLLILVMVFLLAALPNTIVRWIVVLALVLISFASLFELNRINSGNKSEEINSFSEIRFTASSISMLIEPLTIGLTFSLILFDMAETFDPVFSHEACLISCCVALALSIAILRHVRKNAYLKHVSFICSVACYLVLLSIYSFSIKPIPLLFEAVFIVLGCRMIFHWRYLIVGFRQHRFDDRRLTFELVALLVGYAIGLFCQWLMRDLGVSISFSTQMLTLLLMLLTVIDFVYHTTKKNMDIGEQTESFIEGKYSEKNVDTTENNGTEMQFFEEACKRICSKQGLSPREEEVFMLLVRGDSLDMIHTELFISPYTVKSHIYRIYRKLGISSRKELFDRVDEIEKEMRKESPNLPDTNLR